ncbi:MAG: FAD-binding protein [Oscillospiraceae bacterium]|nr:FAD-binding protein [Oscillospiraceae bacterium]
MDNDNNLWDVLIAGTGVGGLYTALSLPENIRVLVLAKREADLCNSALAQGGVAAVYEPVDDDNVTLHTNDTLIAGGFKNNPDSLKVLVNEAASEIQKLIDIGVDFDRDENGVLDRTLEGGHSRRRIFHHKDSTGAEVTAKILEAVKNKPNVTLMDNALLCRMKKINGGFGADILTGDGHITVRCRYAVLATGGIGRVYDFTTNSAIATGDGIAIAYDMGAEIKNLSLIQFHPTAYNNKADRECFLISESVRGEGAYLLNCNKERFMDKYDQRLELAPRDVVSRSIIKESRETGSDSFYLDIRYKGRDYLKERFPMIYDFLLTQGIDMGEDLIPIFPCQHYLMGGIDVDTHARTTVSGLYAVGECSHTGVHGNNRLASNSLLEALVFGHRAAADISEKISGTAAEAAGAAEVEEFAYEQPESTEHIPTGLRTKIRHIMQRSYFVIPDKQAALEGFEEAAGIKKMLDSGEFVIDRDYVEAKSLATAAYLILKEVI